MSRLLIGADFVPTPSNIAVFKNGEIESLFDDELLKEISEVDYRIFNLEVPLTNARNPIMKAGPNLIAASEAVNGFRSIKVDFFTLANNHIMDQGFAGLQSTIDILNNAGISYSGAAQNLNDAIRPYILQLANKKVGIYCCAEHEFSIAEENKAGANPFDPLESLDHIEKLKSRTDYVICLYHGGKEHYRYPSPLLQKTCHKIIEKGADLVICQHTHCIGCKEDYQDGTIVYGQGNFLFDNSDSEYWQTSLLIEVDVETGKLDYIPLQKNGNGVKKAKGIDKDKILSDFYERSEEIKDPKFILTQYSAYAQTMIDNYISSTDILGNSFVFRIINKLFQYKLRKKLAKYIINKHKYWLINQYECEAHRELIVAGLKDCEDK